MAVVLKEEKTLLTIPRSELPAGLWRCNTCPPDKAVQSSANFGWNKRRGHPQYQCSKCGAARRRAYRARMLSNPDKAEEFKQKQREYQDEWRRRDENKQARAEYAQWRTKTMSPEARAERNRKRREYRRKHPDSSRRYSSKAWEKVTADPERHAKLLETRRIQYHLRKEKQGVKVSSRRSPIKYPFHDDNKLLDIEPFLLWLLPLMKSRELSNVELASIMQVDDRRIRRIVFREQKKVSLWLVIRFLDALSGPPVESLYPEMEA